MKSRRSIFINRQSRCENIAFVFIAKSDLFSSLKRNCDENLGHCDENFGLRPFGNLDLHTIQVEI